MKIAIVANTCWNIYNFRRGLVQSFLAKGDEVIVLAPEDAYTKQIEAWGVTWIDTPLEGTGADPTRDFKYVRVLIKAFKNQTPQVALTFTIKSNIYAALAGKRTHVPVICNVSGLGTVFLVKSWTRRVAFLLYRRAFKYASHIFFQNDDDRQLFTSIVSLEKTKISLLPGSGIDLETFKKERLPQKKMIKFLMVARLIIEKGVREYAAAAAMLADQTNVTFTLIGKLDENHARSISKQELDDWVSNGYLTYYPHSDNIAAVMRTHEVIVLPSYREGTPRTLLEGAALGRPLLTTNVAGCKEVVDNGKNGFLFEVRNAEDLARKIKLMCALSAEERTQMGNQSRELVERRFDEKMVIQKYHDTIHRITSTT